MADFIPAYHHILLNEGGYVNDPDDPGGETYKGVARKMHPKWAGWAFIDSMKAVPGFPANIETSVELREMIGNFYLSEFWNKIDGDEIDNQANAQSIFDFAINAGVETAVSLAQKVVKTKVDGDMGPITLKAINAFDPAHFQAAFTVEKIRRYAAIVKKRPVSRKYFYGWVLRAIQ